MEAGTEAVAVLFAEFGDPAAAGGDSLVGDSFGHEQDAGGGDVADVGEEGLDFGEVFGGADDEFPLDVADARGGGEGFKDIEIDAVFFVGLGEFSLLALPGRGVGELGGDGG